MTQAAHLIGREQYLQDCRETDKPWERWEFCDLDGQWYSCITEPGWNAARQYRRKQEPEKYIRIGDAIVPLPTPLREKPGKHTQYYTVAGIDGLARIDWCGNAFDNSRFDMGLVFDTLEKAEQAVAIIRNLFRPQAA